MASIGGHSPSSGFLNCFPCLSYCNSQLTPRTQEQQTAPIIAAAAHYVTSAWIAQSFQQYFHCYVHTLPGTVAYARSCLAMTDVSLLVSWLLPSIICLCQNTVGLVSAVSHPGVDMIHGFGGGDANVPGRCCGPPWVTWLYDLPRYANGSTSPWCQVNGLSSVGPLTFAGHCILRVLSVTGCSWLAEVT
jgi:hypothetical protein